MSEGPDDTTQSGGQSIANFRKQDTFSFVTRGKEVKIKEVKLVYRYGGTKLKEFPADGLYFLSKRTEGVIC